MARTNTDVGGAGGVSSVGATAPITSTGGATPVIGISQPAAGRFWYTNQLGTLTGDSLATRNSSTHETHISWDGGAGKPTSINLENGFLGLFNGMNIKHQFDADRSTFISVGNVLDAIPVSSLGFQNSSLNILNQMNSDESGFHIRAGTLGNQTGLDFAESYMFIYGGGTVVSNLPIDAGAPGQVWTTDGVNAAYWAVPGAGGTGTTSATVATNAPLDFTPTYNNGAGGVGATLTAASVGVLTVDGVATVLNDKVLVKNQVSQLENGLYEVTTEGTASVVNVLTRTTTADQTAELNDLVVIPARGTQMSTPFGQQTVNPSVGTDPIVFTSLSGLYLRQQTSGTQVANQIPVYTGTPLTITKGTDAFTFNDATSRLLIKDTSGNAIFRTTGALQQVEMGDLDGVGPGAKMTIGSGFIFSTIPGTNGTFGVIDENSNYFIELNNATQTYSIGDLNSLNNGTAITISDAVQQINFRGIKYKFNSMQNFANNAAAIVGGLTTGDLYYTNVGGDGIVKIVL